MTAGRVALLTVLLAQPAAAQRLRVSAQAYNVEHRVLFQGSVSERTGMFVGGAGSLRLGPAVLEVGGVMGTLGESGDAAAPSTKVRISTVTLAFRATPWLELGAQAQARRFEADAGVMVWRLMGGTARLTPALGVPGLVGVAEASFYPSATGTGDRALTPALRATLGARYAAPRGPLGFMVGYTFERFDFEGDAPRLEQFRGVVAGMDLRFGR